MAFGNGKWPARMSPKGQGFVFFVTNLLSIIFSYIYIYIFTYTGEIIVRKHQWWVGSLKHIAPTVMINEYRTSKMCSACCQSETKQPSEEEMDQFPEELRMRVQREEKKKNQKRGLLLCCSCNEKMHRDINGASNIRNVLLHRLQEGTRPEYLQKVIACFC